MKETIIKLPEPHSAQKQILREKKRFNVLDCGRRFGKSKLAINLLVERALDGYPVGYFAPTYKLLEGTFKELYLVVNDIVSKKHDNQFIELITGGIIEFWSLDNPLAGRSRKYKRAIVDEAAFAKDLSTSFNEAIRPTLTDLKGDYWAMSTPKGKNDFYKQYMRGVSGEDNWASWKMPTSSNPFIDWEEINSARRELPELAFAQEYLAEFNDNAANPFGIEHIHRNIGAMSNEESVVYGIDLAKYSDWTVIIGLDRFGCVCFFNRFQKDWEQTTNEILSLPYKPMIIDSTGVGDPIVEGLQRERGNITGFKFNVKSKQDLMRGLQRAIQQRTIIYPEGIITQELESFEFQMTSTGVRYSAPSGLHDDAVMALALAVSGLEDNRTFGEYSII